MMKIFVAIPVYDGKLGIETVRCLINEQSAANQVGCDFIVSFVSSDAGIAGARNTLASDFLKSDCDRMIFLDSDITFETGAMVKLAHMPYDFVGGAYRLKQEFESYPIDWLQNVKNLQADKFGLLEVAKLPTGFLCLSRKVFETLQAAHPGREYVHCGHKNFCYFQMPYKDGAFYGEDFFFCKEWCEAGGKIYLDPEIKLTHWNYNPTPYLGHIGQWLKNRPAVLEQTQIDEIDKAHNQVVEMFNKMQGIENHVSA